MRHLTSSLLTPRLPSSAQLVVSGRFRKLLLHHLCCLVLLVSRDAGALADAMGENRDPDGSHEH
jgi:hypothetical protein